VATRVESIFPRPLQLLHLNRDLFGSKRCLPPPMLSWAREASEPGWEEGAYMPTRRKRKSPSPFQDRPEWMMERTGSPAHPFQRYKGLGEIEPGTTSCGKPPWIRKAAACAG